MNDVDLERDLVLRLERRAAQAPVGDGWAGIQLRLAARARRRRRMSSLAAVAAVAAVVVAVAVGGRLGGNGGHRRQQVAAGGDSAALPNLVLDPPGMELEVIEADHAPYPSQLPGRIYLLAEPGRGFDGRVVIARTVPPGAPYGTEADDVASGLARSLTVHKPNGATLHLVSLRVGDQELDRLAAAVDVSDEGVADWTAGALPGGLVVEQSPTFGRVPTFASGMFYGGPQGRLTFSARSGGDAEFLVHLLGRLVVAPVTEVRGVTVAGRPGALWWHDSRSSQLVWWMADGVFAEIAARDLSADRLMAAAESARAVDDETWRRIAAERAVPGPGSPDATTSAMCRLRSEWLAARGNGDRAGEVRATEEVDRLRRDAGASGPGAGNDVGVVLQRLAEAMAAGDESAVREMPAGGCR